jgi:hypothetical protein
MVSFIVSADKMKRSVGPGNTKGGSITVPLTSCLTGLESAVCQLTIFAFTCKADIQTSQTGGQWYSDTSPFSIPWLEISFVFGTLTLPQCDVTHGTSKIFGQFCNFAILLSQFSNFLGKMSDY